MLPENSERVKSDEICYQKVLIGQNIDEIRFQKVLIG